jgi:hypothetical protein
VTPSVHLLAVQGSATRSSGTLGVSIEIVAAMALACLLLTVTVLLLTKLKGRREAMIVRERQARERMQELCPNGWSARILLYGNGAPLPDDAPSAGDRKVCVEWTEYGADPAGHTEVAVARRMWARTITGALRGMLADRELDVELEMIERKVIEDTSEGGGETSPPAPGPQTGPSH